MYSPFDFNQSIAHRAEYVEERLKGGTPVVGVSYESGVLLFAVRRTQRKVFEIYDQLMYAAIGNQADVEAVRLASIDFAHQEGFARSPDDVSIQRLVGFAISPPLKRAFGDPMSTPNVLRALFVEIGAAPESDSYFVLNYDGEFETRQKYSAVGPSDASEEAMLRLLDDRMAEGTLDLPGALQLAAEVWRTGASRLAPASDEDEDETPTPDDERDPLAEALEKGHLEAAILERNTPRESKFRILRADELESVMAAKA